MQAVLRLSDLLSSGCPLGRMAIRTELREESDVQQLHDITTRHRLLGKVVHMRTALDIREL